MQIRQKISTKYLIWLIPIIGIAFMLVGIYTYNLIKQHSLIANQEMTSKMGEEISKALKTWICDQIKIGKTLAEDPRIVQACLNPQDKAIRNKAEAFLIKVHRRFPYHENIPLAIKMPLEQSFQRKVDHRWVQITNGTFFIDTVNGRTIGKCGTHISYIPPAFAGQDHFISEVYPSILRGNPIFVISFPVKKDNRVLGALLLSPQMNYFSEMFIEKTTFGKTGYICMIDNRGLIISHPQQELILRKENGQKIKPLEKVYPLSQVKHIVDRIFQGETYFQETYENRLKMYSVSHFDRSGLNIKNKWLIVCVRELDDIYSDAHVFILSITIFSIAMVIILFVLVYFLTHKIIGKPLAYLQSIAEELQVGNTTIRGHLPRSDEIGNVIQAFNRMIDNTNDIVHQAQNIAKGHYEIMLKPRSSKDLLTQALINMTSALKRFHDDSQKQHWLKTGLAELSNCMRGTQDLNSLTSGILSYLARYLDALMGMVYVSDTNDNLRRVASYACDDTQNSQRLQLDKTLVGQVAKDKKMRIITDIPGNYVSCISSGSGHARPNHLLIYPMIYENKVVGIIELASFKGFSKDHVTLLEAANESIAIAIDAAQSRTQLNKLLAETRLQALELQKKQDELEKINQYKSDFLANMSHELRTPMNGVIGMTEILLNTPLSDEQKDFAETIYVSANGLLSLLNDILDLSKIEAGKLALESFPFNLEELVTASAQLLSTKSNEKGLELIVRYPPTIPKHFLGDAGRLRQILLNLIGNAIKFTEKGHVLIDIKAIEVTEIFANIWIEVVDTGIGISESNQERLFKKFSQVNTARKYGGTGLGLTICKQLIEMMDGTIGVRSKEGDGATFYFNIKLPITKEIQEDIIPEQGIKSTKILIVDDNAINRKTLDEHLKQWKVQCQVASSGKEALEKLYYEFEQKKPFNIAILDHHMPEMNGEELGRIIKKDPQLKSLILIILTSMGDRSDIQKFKDIGFASFLIKPMPSTKLYYALVKVWSAFLNGESSPDLIGYDQQRLTKQIHADVLLVEDNPVNQKIASRVLKKFGCNVKICNNGAEGFLAAKHSNYDIIFMDVSMPVMDGFEATAKIRKYEGDQKYTPIIAMTAHAMKGDREKCITLGMDDYITKPVAWNIVYELLIHYCPSKIGSTEDVTCLPATNKPIQSSKPETTSSDAIDTLQELELDQDSLKIIAEEGSEFLTDFFEATKEQLFEIMSKIKITFAKKDQKKILFQIHTLKGLVGNVGAVKYVNKIQEIENKVKNSLNEGFQSDYAVLQDLKNKICYTLDQVDIHALVERTKGNQQ